MSAASRGYVFISDSSCAKNAGSRPAMPMGEARHSPYTERFNSSVGLPAASRRISMFGTCVSTRLVASWQPMQLSEVRYVLSAGRVRRQTWSKSVTGNAAPAVSGA